MAEEDKPIGVDLGPAAGPPGLDAVVVDREWEEGGDDPGTDGAGGLFGEDGGGPPGRGGSGRRPSPVRARVHWVDVVVPKQALVWQEAWAARHPSLAVRGPDGRARSVATAQLGLEEALAAYLADCLWRDVLADGDRAPEARQYDWAGLGVDIPLHLQEALAPPAAEKAASQVAQLKAQFRDTLVAFGRGDVPREHLLALAATWAEEPEEAIS